MDRFPGADRRREGLEIRGDWEKIWLALQCGVAQRD